jgi:methionyl-tRNA formyltransferase
MRVVYIGTGEIGLPALEWLIQSPKHDVVRALSAGVPVFQPERLKHHLAEFAAMQADIAVVIAYGQILTLATLAVPRLGCINVHASLLPKHRGAAPIQAAILAGDAESGVTLMHIDQGLDSGDIILQERVPILPTDTGGSLHDKLAVIAPVGLKRALDGLESGTAQRVPQDHTQATHQGKLRREDGYLDWTESAVQLERRIRAFNPWPGTYALLPGSAVPLKIHAASLVPDAEVCAVAGTVVTASAKQGLLVATGAGLLEITQLQGQGGRRMTAREYLAGQSLPVGERLG